MANKKIMIVGGNGFIGRNFCTYLIEQKEIVYSFDIQKPESEDSRINYIVGDFFDDKVLEEAISDMDVIIHSISTVNPGNSNERYMQGYSRDFIQSIRLFEMAIEKKIRVIFLSSGGTVYGIQDIQPIDELQLPLPINHYGAVKLCIENVIRTFNTQLHTKMIIARVSNPFGPGQDYRKGVGFVDAAIKKAINKEDIEIWGDGHVIRDYVYIEDVCKMLYALIYYEGKEEVFNVSSNEGISLNHIVEILTKLDLNPKVLYKEKRSVDVPKIVLDNSKILEISGLTLLKFEEGLCQYYAYLKNLDNHNRNERER